MYGPEYMANPATVEGSASDIATGQGKSVADLWDTISKFKSLESTSMNSMITLITKLLDNKEDKRQWEEEMALKRETSKTTPGGQLNESLARLRRDIERGEPFYELKPRYTAEGIPESQIREMYNAGPLPKQIDPGTGKAYGGATETSRGFASEDSGDIKTEMSLRKEFNSKPIVKDYVELSQRYGAMNTALAASNSKDKKSLLAIDQTLITTFNKMLDPNSVVREGEYARSIEGQSALANIQGKIDRVIQGGSGLTQSDRSEMVRVAEKIMNDMTTRYQKEADYYKEIAERSGVNPEMVVRSEGGNEQINNVAGDARKKLEDAGFSSQEIDEYLKLRGLN